MIKGDSLTNLYFRARSYYQYSYIWEIYKQLGGKFILTNPEQLQRLQSHVGEHNCYSHPKRQDLPEGVSGLIMEMTLNKHYYLKRSDNFTNVLIYHGMGLDKNFKGRRFPIKRYDHYFVSGEKDYLKYKHYSYGLTNFNKRVVKIGHLRSDLIINNKSDSKVLTKKLEIKDTSRKNILFAPTWSRGHGTLLQNYEIFCSQITKEHNLLIRTHPYDVKNYPLVQEFIDMNKIKNVYLIDPNEVDLIDNLSMADLLIGENSSLMYDWIFFNKPVIIVKTSTKDLEKARWATQKKFRVSSCGYEYTPRNININKLIEDSLVNHPFDEQIKHVRDSTFYFNDGKAVERAVEWIKHKLDSMN